MTTLRALHPGPQLAAATPGTVTTLGLLPILAISAATMAAPAFAQTTGEVLLGDVTVGGTAETSYTVSGTSSEKRTAPLLDTPRSTTVVTQRQIEERAVRNVSEVLRTTPGVTLGSGEGGTVFGDRPFIRGFEASSDVSVDGVRNTSRSTPESFNLEAVEINLGANSAEQGRGSTGGGINLVTKQAREGQTFHRFSVLAGNANQFRSTYDGNVDFGNGIAARINLLADDSGVPGRNVTKDRKLGIAGALSWRLDSGAKLSFSASHLDTDGIPDFGVPVANNAYRADFGTGFGAGTLADPWRPIGDVNPNNYYGFANRDYRKTQVTNMAFKVEHDFGNGWQLASRLGYVNDKQDYIINRPSYIAGGTVDSLIRGYDRDNDNLTFSTNLSGRFFTGSIEHSISAGVEISRERIRSNNFNWGAGTSPQPVTPLDLYNPDSWVAINGALVPTGTSGATTNTKSLYVFNTAKLNEQFSINLGLRYDNYDVTVDGVPPLQRKDSLLNGQVGLVWKPAPNGTVYLSYATSSTPAGEYVLQVGNNLASGGVSTGTINSDPEKSRNIELGTKWDLNGLIVTGALFQTEKTNQRVQNAGVWELTAATRSRGLELGVAGQINDRWGIAAGYTYMDVAVTKGPDAGRVPINTARNTLGLWTTYDVNEKWRIGGGVNFVDSKFGNNANTVLIPSYWRADVMTTYNISDTASLQLNVNNLFDKVYYDSTHQGIFATRGPGRSITAKLDMRF